jgi:hypothetical protein
MNDPDPLYTLYIIPISKVQKMVGMIRRDRKLDLRTETIPNAMLNPVNTVVIFEPKGTYKGTAIQLQEVKTLPAGENTLNITYAEFITLCKDAMFACPLQTRQNILTLAEQNPMLWAGLDLTPLNIIRQITHDASEIFTEPITQMFERLDDLESARKETEALQEQFLWYLQQLQFTSPVKTENPVTKVPSLHKRARHSYIKMEPGAVKPMLGAVKMEPMFGAVKMEPMFGAVKMEPMPEAATELQHVKTEPMPEAPPPADGSKHRPIQLDD